MATPLEKLKGIHTQSYDDLPFETFLDKYQGKFYSDLSKEDFRTKIGYSAKPVVATPPTPPVEAPPALVEAPKPVAAPKPPPMAPKAGEAVMRAAGPPEEKAWYTRWFGIGDEPEYRKEETEKDIARYKTIRPGEHELTASQLARPAGFVAGAAAETARLALQPMFALTSAMSIADVGVRKAPDPVGVARILGKKLGVQLDPKTSLEIAERLGGDNPDEVMQRKNKDLYRLIQEDTEEALGGTIQSLAMDILPLLPAKDKEGWEESFKSAFKRGEAFPAGVAAFGPIVFDALGKVAQGEIQEGTRILASRPLTLFLTLAPFAGKIKNARVKKWLADTEARIIEGEMPDGALQPEVVLDSKGQPIPPPPDVAPPAPPKTVTPPRKTELRTRVAQTFRDPLEQPTARETARVETIYEEARATRVKAKRATEKLAEEARKIKEEGTWEREPKVVVTQEGAVPVEGVPVESARLTKVKAQLAEPIPALEPTKAQATKLKKLNDASWEKQGALDEVNRLVREVENNPDANVQQLQYAESLKTRTLPALEAELRVAQQGYSDYFNKLSDIWNKRQQNKRNLLEQQRDKLHLEEIRKKELSEAQYEAVKDAKKLQLKQDIAATFNREQGLVVEETIGLRPEITEVGAVRRHAGIPEHIRAAVSDIISDLQYDVEGLTQADKIAYATRVARDVNTPLGKKINQLPPEGIGLLAEWAEGTLTAHDFQLRSPKGRRVTNVPSQEIIRYPIEPAFIDAVVESFEANLSPDIATQLTPKIRTIIAEGAAKIVNDNVDVFLEDPSIRKGFSEYLYKTFFKTANTRAGKKRHTDAINRALKPHIKLSARGKTFTTAPESINLGGKEIFMDQIASSLHEYLGLEKGAKYHDRLMTEIRDRVLMRVRNASFVESLRENIRRETIEGANPQQVVQRIKDSAELPFVIKTTPQLFDAIIEGVAEAGDALRADTLSKYRPPSPELGAVIGENTYVSPSFNSAFTGILRSLETIGKAEVGFNRFFAHAKRGYTSRYLSAARNNYKSNILLFNMYYGALDGVVASFDSLVQGASAMTKAGIPELTGVLEHPRLAMPLQSSFSRFAKGKPKPWDPATELVSEEVLFDAIRESGIMDNTNISNEVSMLNKGDLLTDVIEHSGRKIGPDATKRAHTITNVLKRFNSAQDAAYTFGDNFFKFMGTWMEATETLDLLKNMEKGKRVKLQVGESLKVTIEKGETGEYFRIRANKRIPITEQQIAKLAAKGGARLAAEKFVDYERIPGYLQWMRRAGPFGIVSLFTTWAYQMMDIPFVKKGIVSHFAKSQHVIVDTNSPTIAKKLSRINVNRGAGRAAVRGLATTATQDEENEGDMRRMLSWNKRGLNPLFYQVSDIDPLALVYRDEQAINFFGSTETMTRALMGAGFWAAEKLENGFSMALGKPKSALLMNVNEIAKLEGKEEGALIQDVRKLYTKWKAGGLVRPSDTLKIAQVAGNPIFDLFDLMLEADKNPRIDIEGFIAETGWTLVAGGTTKKIMEEAYRAAAGDVAISAGEGSALSPWAKLYKKAAYQQYSPQQEHIFVRELINMAFGTGYRYAWAHRYINKKDVGKFNSWADEYAQRLSASLTRKQKKRLQVLQQNGYGPESPEYKLAVKRYSVLYEGVAREKAAMKQRLWKSLKRSGIYEKSKEIQRRRTRVPLSPVAPAKGSRMPVPLSEVVAPASP